MTRSFEGKVALITGAGQGQGRSHAIRFAELGADLLLVDVCADIPEGKSPQATSEDLAETAALVEKIGRRAITGEIDVRDYEGLAAFVEKGVAELGKLDIVVANAGITSMQLWDEVTTEVWEANLGVNLTGVWNTCRASIPHIVNAGGGSVIIISSSAGLKGLPFLLPYVVAKTGVIAMMRSLAVELGNKNVRVNAIAPAGVDTSMLASAEEFPRLAEALPEAMPMFQTTLTSVEAVQPEDISNAVAFLASDEAKYITGICLPVDLGTTSR